MTISLTPFTLAPLCQGHTWSVDDVDALAEMIAGIALGQSRHVQKILVSAKMAGSSPSDAEAKGAINLLTASAEAPWHRDGWMFQAMSWMAALRQRPHSPIRPPHMIHAHKGFDGLQLVIDQAADSIEAAIIFEDKATDNPRGMIQSDVWPDFASLEAGEKDHVLTAEVVTLLQTVPGVDIDRAIENVIWKQARHYRVSITTGEKQSTLVGRKRLFKGFDTTASGDIQRRQADIFHVDNLRAWMDILATKAVVAINSRVAAHV